MVSILLTGASGFVGHHLINTLLEQPYQLHIFGRRDVNNRRFPFFKGEITSSTNFLTALDGIDVVIHSAARVHVMKEDQANPLKAFKEVNTLGTLNMAKQAAAQGVKRFIFISTIKVNGETTTNKSPFSAFDEKAPEDPYGISKAEAELGLLEIANETDMEVVIIRPPLVYGEGVKANFASLLKLVSKGLPLPFGLIKNNRRSMISVYNLVDFIKTCIDHPKAANQVFLVSDDHDLSTAEMVELMAISMGKKSRALPVPVWCFKVAGKVVRKEAVIDRLVGSLQLDINHTKETLDWKPAHSVEDGFKLAAKNLFDNC